MILSPELLDVKPHRIFPHLPESTKINLFPTGNLNGQGSRVQDEKDSSWSALGATHLTYCGISWSPVASWPRIRAVITCLICKAHLQILIRTLYATHGIRSRCVVFPSWGHTGWTDGNRFHRTGFYFNIVSKKKDRKKLFFKKKCKSKGCSVCLLSRSEFYNYKISFLFICLLDFPPTKYI